MRHLGQMETRLPWRDQSRDQEQSMATHPCIWGDTGYRIRGSGGRSGGKALEKEAVGTVVIAFTRLVRR